MMNILFLCKTPYHIMVAAQIALTKHPHDRYDIVLFNTMSHVGKINDNIKKSKFFGSSRICCMKKVNRPGQNPFRRLLSKISIFSVGLMERFSPRAEKSYDMIYLTPGGWVDKQIILKYKKVNKECKVFFFEDGMATYRKQMQESYRKPDEKDFKSIKVYKEISGLYVFSPELLEWTPPFPVYPIEKLNNSDAYMNIVNSIFQYDEMQDDYNKRYIFFEESYFADGSDINDVETIQDVSAVIQAENLFIKIHPRNRENRFSSMGIVTNKDTEIPWELIALNENLSEKILITVTSSAPVNTLLIIKSHPEKVILLMDYEKINKNALLPVTEWLKRVSKEYGSVVSMPRDREELAKALLG